MYADAVTQSMQRAIDETERRRNKQIGYNNTHGITPKGVQKQIKDLIDGVYQPGAEHEALKAAQTLSSYHAMNEKELSHEFKRLEREMLEAARNLEFEKAAELRDRLKQLRTQVFGVVEEDHLDGGPMHPEEPSRASQARKRRPATTSIADRGTGR